jgi:hypothetical protein
MSATLKKGYVTVQKPDILELRPETILPAGWKLNKLSNRQERQIYYDTFEWQAFEKGIVIIKKKNTLYQKQEKARRNFHNCFSAFDK